MGLIYAELVTMCLEHYGISGDYGKLLVRFKMMRKAVP
jgi:hypothetical protein